MKCSVIIEPKQHINHISFDREFCANLGESFDFVRKVIYSQHNLVLSFWPSFAAGINQLSCPRVAAGFTSN